MQEDEVWDLLCAARADVPGAIETLFERFDPTLNSIAYRYRFVSFEDALQEARLSFWLCVQSYNPQLNVAFGAYVWRKVHGDVRSRMRRLWTLRDRQTYAHADTEGDGYTVWDAAHVAHRGPQRQNPDEDAVDWQLIIHQAKLSPREALVIRMGMRGWVLSEIAEMERVSIDTVKTWRKRALRKLRRLLRESEMFDAQQ